MMADNDNGRNEDMPPLRIAGAGAASPQRKRFYKVVTVGALAPPAPTAEPAYQVLLDGRAVRTPARNAMTLPSRQLADAVAAEWLCQATTIEPRTMPLTRIVNSALDGVQGHESEVLADVVKYAGSDLLCYRAERPDGLVARQSALWDPVLAWIAATLPGEFHVATGLMHAAQDETTLARLAARLACLSALPLAALHVLTTLSGSALLALATCEGHLTAARAWELAHVDEDWQISQWGEDAEAAARRQARWVEFEAAGRLLALAR